MNKPVSAIEDLVNTFMQCDGQILVIIAMLIDRLCKANVLERSDIVSELRQIHARRSPEVAASADFVFHTLLTFLGEDSGIQMVPANQPVA